MSSSPEIENFDISEYDLDFSQGNYKKRKKLSKKQQIFGIFASDSDDERDISKPRKRDFTAPISFVSSGFKDEIDKKSEDDNEQLMEDPDIKQFVEENLSSDEEITLVPEKQKIQKPTMRARNKTKQTNAQSKSSGFASWDKSGIGLKLLQKMGYQQGQGLGKDGQGILTPIQVVQRVGKGSVGYAGPEFAKAPKRGCDINKDEGEGKAGESEEEEDDTPRYKKTSKKSKKATNKANYMTAAEIISNAGYDNDHSVKKKGIFLANSEILKAKVIDMTQKNKKVYENYEQGLKKSFAQTNDHISNSISGETATLGSFDVPILKHNIKLILSDLEGDIRKKDRNMRFEEEQIEAFTQEMTSLKSKLRVETLEISALHNTLEVINEFSSFIERSMDENLNIDNCAKWLSKFKESAQDLPELPCLLAAVAKPLLDSSFRSWQPLQQPTYGLALFTEWKSALNDERAFEVILETVWLSTVRREIQNIWNPKNPDSLLKVIEAWAPLLTERLLNLHLLSLTIFPKLQETLDEWNPLTDVVPVHTWLHPWLLWFLPKGTSLNDPNSRLPSGFLNQMPMLHEKVRHKFAMSLNNWHPSDSSAYSILLPWHNIWGNSEMTIFLHKHIIPKLANVLNSFQINPTNQNIDPWKWVVRWTDLITPTVLINLLERYFVPKWNSVLSIWLNQAVQYKTSDRNDLAGKTFAEIGEWYAGWKSQFPETIYEHPTIKNLFMGALNMMEHAMKGLPVQDPTLSNQKAAPVYPGIAKKPNVAANTKNTLYQQAAESAMSGYKKSAYKIHANIREQVEEEAAKLGHLFYPMQNRFHEDKQVYKLVKVNVFFDRNVPFYYSVDDNQWHPVSCKELFEVATK